MKKTNILYFTGLLIDSPSNGGSICIFNHISKLSQNPRVNLFVVTTGTKDKEEPTKSQLNRFNIDYYFIPCNESGYSWHSWPKYKKIQNILRIKFPFMLETGSFNQEHISEKLIELCELNNIEIVVVEYLHSILLFPQFLKLKQRKILITQNREADLYRDSLKRDRAYQYRLNAIQGFISYLRLKFFEEKINRGVDKYVALTEADIPEYLARKENAVAIPPQLDVKSEGWNYSGTKTVFFIGSSDHYPNYLAIDWILCQLAPSLLKVDPTVKILIAGKLPKPIPDRWKIENAVLLGFISQERVESLFKTSDLFICPTEYQYGVKIKVIEAISYGTPILATKTALEGSPYLSGIPVLDLRSPDQTASLISNALADPATLKRLSQTILDSAYKFSLSEKDRWEEVLFD
jgi:glycosyltransferase involved in cell wall biosynthesis